MSRRAIHTCFLLSIAGGILILTLSFSIITPVFGLENTDLYSNRILGLSTKTQVAASPIPTHVPTPSLPIESIETYEKIASQAIQASNNAIDLMKWVIGVIITIAGGVVAYFVKSQKELIDNSIEMKKNLSIAEQRLEAGERQLHDVSSNYIQLLHELNHQSMIFIPPATAMSAFETGRITEEQYRESQIWFAWAKWFYGGDEAGFMQMREFKSSPKALPPSICRIIIMEIEQINNRSKIRGVIYDREQLMLDKLLELLDLSMAKKTIPTPGK